MKIVTFNIRFAYDTDGIHSFIHRAGLILDAIKERKPDIPATFHDFGRGEHIKIDYIFTDPLTAASVSSVSAWKDCVNGIYLSDHYPVEMICDDIWIFI